MSESPAYFASESSDIYYRSSVSRRRTKVLTASSPYVAEHITFLLNNFSSPALRQHLYQSLFLNPAPPVMIDVNLPEEEPSTHDQVTTSSDPIFSPPDFITPVSPDPSVSDPSAD